MTATTGESQSDKMARSGYPGSVQAVERAVALLKAVGASNDPLTVRQLAAACGLNRSTAWRLLLTLEQHGMLEREPGTQGFQVGHAAIQLAASTGHDAIVRLARPVLEQLAGQVRETVTLLAATSLSLSYVDQVDPPGMIGPNWLGRPVPLHATSAGKLFLALIPDREREAVLPRQLRRFTPATIVDRRLLRRDFEQIRRLGYSTCFGEYEEFSNGVSAAVVDHHERPIAIVNLWGPNQRVTAELIDELGHRTRQAAGQIRMALDS